MTDGAPLSRSGRARSLTAPKIRRLAYRSACSFPFGENSHLSAMLMAYRGRPPKRSVRRSEQETLLFKNISSLGQLIRFGISGAGLALMSALIYEGVLGVATPQFANAMAFLASSGAGYAVHSQWSFRDQRPQNAPVGNVFKFMAVNLMSFLVNVFWVWLLVTRLKLSPHLPLLPILGLTPWLSFWLHRSWTFGVAWPNDNYSTRENVGSRP
jgi:putative flippase GtrA